MLLLSIENLAHSYGERTLFKNVNFNIETGDKIGLIGINGTGKSTLIEGIAVALGFNPEGGSKNFNFFTNNSHSVLSDYLTVCKGVKMAKDGFFLRAESYYNFASNIDELDE